MPIVSYLKLMRWQIKSESITQGNYEAKVLLAIPCKMELCGDFFTAQPTKSIKY